METLVRLNPISTHIRSTQIPAIHPQGIGFFSMTKPKKRKTLLSLTAKTSTYVGYSKEAADSGYLIGKAYATAQGKEVSLSGLDDGAGIRSFLMGKNIMITGATGFIAKVIVEKILRTAPDVGKILLLIQAKSGEEARKRLETEILDAEVFRLLKQEHGELYRSYMFSKLIPVPGNLMEAGLGLNPELATETADEVDYIVNSAGNTTFDERYDVSFEINVQGVCRLMKFAKGCKKLKLFLHVSTAYASGVKQGKILEEAICMEEIVEKNGYPAASTHTKQLLDIEAEMKLISDSKMKLDDKIQWRKMKEIGLSRARSCGWPNTYLFTKAMGELMIYQLRGELPVVIIRPTVVESTIKTPFPGWIQGNRTIDPIIILFGKGLLTSFLGDPNGVFDVIPADMVVNATLAAMANHKERKMGLNIYHIASSSKKPLLFSEVFEYIYQHFNMYPFIDSKGCPVPVRRMKLYESMDDYLSNISTPQPPLTASPQKTLQTQKKVMEHAMHLGKIYEPYTFYKGWFDDTNTQNLMSAMSNEERKEFDIDVQNIDWKHYFMNSHILGLRTHVLMGRGSPLKSASPHGSI